MLKLFPFCCFAVLKKNLWTLNECSLTFSWKTHLKGWNSLTGIKGLIPYASTSFLNGSVLPSSLLLNHLPMDESPCDVAVHQHHAHYARSEPSVRPPVAFRTVDWSWATVSKATVGYKSYFRILDRLETTNALWFVEHLPEGEERRGRETLLTFGSGCPFYNKYFVMYELEHLTRSCMNWFT